MVTKPSRGDDDAGEPLKSRSLTELGQPDDPTLATEIETDRVTAEILESTGMRRFFEVWQQAGASRGRSMPARADIDILEIGTYIGSLTLLEVVDGGADFRYRVSAEGASKLLGEDYTGQLLSETSRDQERIDRLMQRYRRVVASKVPWYARTPAIPEMPVTYTERLVVPLSEDGETVSMLLLARRSGPRRRKA